jgi:hypothetical protein
MKQYQLEVNRQYSELTWLSAFLKLMRYPLPSGNLMRKTLLALACVSSFMLPTANSADNNMRPGLWEITTASDLLWLAPQISPDEMQNLKNLAEQYGVDMPQIQMGEATSKACITQEMAEQQQLPVFYQAELGCNTKNATRSGNNYIIEFVCSSPQLTGNGTAEGTFTSPESFSGRTQFGGMAQGIPVNEHADISGRWINSSCGTVKPL